MESGKTSRPWLYFMIWIIFLHSCSNEASRDQVDQLNKKIDNISSQIQTLQPPPRSKLDVQLSQ